ncbi:hypothetical protein HYS00_02740 [Candidatus Microgenomates bacterium]|nr:hypothetical protein [Candidatus Microgenomates bacterium]
MKNPYYLKVFIYTAVVIGTALTLWAFVNQFLPVRRAALGPDGAAVVFTPASGTISTGQQQVIKVRVSPVSATNKNNGFDLFFKATGPIKLVSIGNNAAFKDPLRYSVTDTAAEYARVLHFNSGDPSDTIPTETAQAFAEFDLTVQGTGNGTATIQFDGTQSEISGEGTITKTLMDIETTTATYQVGAGGGTSPTIAPPTATTVPVATDTPVPGGGGGTDTCTELPPAYFSGIGYTAKYENHVVTFTGSGGKIIVYQANVPYWGPDWRATAAPIIVQGNSVEAPSGFFQVDLI